jgi:hypothetical protein
MPPRPGRSAAGRIGFGSGAPLLRRNELAIGVEKDARRELHDLASARVDDPCGARVSRLPAQIVDGACEKRGIASPGERPFVSGCAGSHVTGHPAHGSRRRVRGREGERRAGHAGARDEERALPVIGGIWRSCELVRDGTGWLWDFPHVESMRAGAEAQRPAIAASSSGSKADATSTRRPSLSTMRPATSSRTED